MVALGVGWAALATDHSGSLMIHTILLPQTVPNVSHSIDFLFLQSVRQRPPRRPTKIFSGSTTANTRREAIKVEKKKNRTTRHLFYTALDDNETGGFWCVCVWEVSSSIILLRVGGGGI